MSIIVGVGASAGGLEAFSELLKNLPIDTGMSFILIQHLEPTHDSKLSEILSRVTTIPVKQITNNTSVTPNQIYVIPPDKYLAIRNGKLLLSERMRKDGIYMPIDYFFQSLARDQKNRAIGIILSGTASDGTIGLSSIKAEGGLTFAQDQKSAKYPGMPKSAYESGNVDLVLPPDKIAKELTRIGKHPYLMHTDTIKTPDRKKLEKEIKQESNELNEIFNELLAFSGVDFSSYKLSTVLRRLNRRMVINKIHIMKEYENLIKKDKDEVKKLYLDLLINVTSFFRDPGTYKTLTSKIYPKLFKNISPNHPLRVWVTGCSTGEEVYSIAISLREFLDKKSNGTNFQIFATDISDLSIEKARAGVYPELSLKEIPDEIKNKYFIKSNGMYQVNKFIRDRCIFARHDLIQDPPFSRVDLISCRNLLIYLSPELQKKVIPRFHYSLNPGGYLLLGSSESIGKLGNLFQIVDVKNKIYKRKELEKRIDYNFYISKIQTDKIDYKKYSPDNIDVLKETDALILSKYAPAAILINQKLDILQFRGNIKEYLDPSPGNASLNLFKMIREGMNVELHTTIKKATHSKKAEYFENVKINKNGSSKIIDLEVVPLKTAKESSGRYFLILFIDRSYNNVNKTEKKKVKGSKIFLDEHYENLKSELKVTKEHLQSIIEEREGANEELRSALEELQSSNEELQSTNEELETAREELQSTNEELITTNDELENRNNELNEINNDLNNLLVSINTAIVLLGKDLKIRRYTLKAEPVWNLIPGDIGRPISNMKPNFEIKDLEKLILEVMDDLESKEIEIRDNKNINYSMKIRPYKTMDGKIDGAVISLYDVDVRTKAMAVMTTEKDYFESVMNTVNQPLLVLDKNHNIHHANESYYSTFHSSDKETIGKSVYLINDQLWNIPLLKQLLEEIIPQNKSMLNFEVNVNGDKKMLLNARILELPNTEEKLILLAIVVSS